MPGFEDPPKDALVVVGIWTATFVIADLVVPAMLSWLVTAGVAGGVSFVLSLGYLASEEVVEERG